MIDRFSSVIRISYREQAADDQRRVLLAVRHQLIDGPDSLPEVLGAQQRLHLFDVLASVRQAVRGRSVHGLSRVSAEDMCS